MIKCGTYTEAASRNGKVGESWENNGSTGTDSAGFGPRVVAVKYAREWVATTGMARESLETSVVPEVSESDLLGDAEEIPSAN